MTKITTKGPDPAKVASHVYKKLMENKLVRVFEIRFKPGDEAETHWHPNHLVVVLEAGTLEVRPLKGPVQKISAKAGDVAWMDTGHHSAVNKGNVDLHALVIELKGSTKKLGK
jgi:quercetin dioxygenase-like cupin family protein